MADEKFRRDSLMAAHKALTEAPEKMTKAVIDTAKHEVHEFKEASAGVKAVLKGGKMSDEQKHAFKTVATHMAIGLSAAALTATGPLAIAGTFGKGLARHIAAKAVSNALGHLHVLDELGHIGHGVQHVLDKLAAEVDPEKAMANFVAAAVAKELNKLEDDDVKAVAEGMDGEDEEKKSKEAAVLARFLRASAPVEEHVLEAATFCDGNGNYHMEIVEQRRAGHRGEISKEYLLRSGISHFGVEGSFSSPLGTKAMLDWLVAALQRTTPLVQASESDWSRDFYGPAEPSVVGGQPVVYPSRMKEDSSL